VEGRRGNPNPIQEEDYELLAIDQGLEEAEKRCKDMGALLEEIESIEEVPQFEA
jgi:hypothetical protein